MSISGRWIGHGFEGVVSEDGGRVEKGKVNKLLRTEEESELQGYYKNVIDKPKSATKTQLTSLGESIINWCCSP